MNEQKTFLWNLLAAPSPTGFEFAAQKLWASYIKQYADSVECDAYGNTWAWLYAADEKAPTIMLEAHADEIGFMVKYVTPEGFLRVDKIGGSDAAVARGRRLRILGTKGEVFGITGNTAIHLRRDSLGSEKCPTVDELYVDVGAKSDKEVAELGIRIGTPMVYADGPIEMYGDKVVCRALDNRMGGYVLAEVARKLSKSKKRPAWNIVLVNAVQEEIGLRGAEMAAHTLHPDAAVCIDVTHATDTPDINKSKYGDTRLGKGPELTHGASNQPLLVKALEKAASKAKVDVQHGAAGSYSGTDTDIIYRSRGGVPAALISLPLRYMHSPVETVDMRDVEATVKVLTTFLQALSKSDSFRYRLDELN